MKWALVLGSGGARGLAHIGVLKYLEEKGFRPDLIVGCSAGALVGGVWASGVSAFEMEKVALTSGKKYLKIKPGFTGFIDQQVVAAFLNSVLKKKKLEEFPIKFCAVATDLTGFSEVVFDRGNAVTAILASISIPILFPPVEMKNRMLVDGGAVDPLPVKVAKKRGFRKVVAVNVILNSRIKFEDGVKAEALSVDSSESTIEKARKLIKKLSRENIFNLGINSLIALERSLVSVNFEVWKPTVLIEPEVPENVKTLDFDKADVAIIAGYQAAKKILKNVSL